MIVHVNFFIKLAGWDKSREYQQLATRAILKGEDKIEIPDEDYRDACLYLEEKERQNKLLNDTAQNNNRGIELEKEGRIDEAIVAYEKNVEAGYPALHSFERLMKIYRRRKDYSNEVRIISRAIDVFLAENQRRAEKAIEQEPQLRDQILEALISCKQVMGNRGFYIFVPYDVIAMRDRLRKSEILLSKIKQ